MQWSCDMTGSRHGRRLNDWRLKSGNGYLSRNAPRLAGVCEKPMIVATLAMNAQTPTSAPALHTLSNLLSKYCMRSFSPPMSRSFALASFSLGPIIVISERSKAPNAVESAANVDAEGGASSMYTYLQTGRPQYVQDNINLITGYAWW